MRALALELTRAELNTLGAVQTWVRFTEKRHLVGHIAQFQVNVEHGVVRAVHEGNLAHAVADHELGLVERVREEVTRLGVGANVVRSSSANLSLLWGLWGRADLGGNSAHVGRVLRQTRDLLN